MKVVMEYKEDVIVDKIITKGETLLENLGFNNCEIGYRKNKFTYTRRQYEYDDKEYIIFSLKDIYEEELTVYLGMGWEDSIVVNSKLLEAINCRFNELIKVKNND